MAFHEMDVLQKYNYVAKSFCASNSLSYSGVMKAKVVWKGSWAFGEGSVTYACGA